MPHKIKPVKIRHPKGLESEVDAPSVPHWERAGWSRADAAEEAAAPVDTVKTTPAKSERRTTKGEG
jgi:hypothetical protein